VHLGEAETLNGLFLIADTLGMEGDQVNAVSPGQGCLAVVFTISSAQFE